MSSNLFDKSMTPKIYVKFQLDGMQATCQRLAEVNDSDSLRRINQLSDMGNGVWRAWAEAKQGSALTLGDGSGTLEVCPESLSSLNSIARQYAEIMDFTVSVGVGKDLQQASQAFQLAQLLHGDRICYYNENTLIDIATQKDGLKKATNLTDDTAPQAGAGEANVARYFASYQSPIKPHQEAEPKFRQLADQHETRQKAKKVNDSGDLDKLKEKVSDVLQGVRKQMHVIGQLKEVYPDTYKSIIALIQSVVALGQSLSDSEESLQKAEKAPGYWKARGLRGLKIPNKAHPRRIAWDASYKQAIANHFTGGNPQALKPVQVPVDQVKATDIPLDPDRYSLYHSMAAAGDTLPPLVVSKDAAGWTLINDINALRAAQAAGRHHVDALELPVMAKGQEMVEMGGYDFGSDAGGFDKGELLPGGLAEDMSPTEFDPKALAEGMEVEKEHTSDKAIQQRIAMDHLTEDPKYYEKLKTIEKSDTYLHATTGKNVERILHDGVIKASPSKKTPEGSAAWGSVLTEDDDNSLRGWGRAKALLDKKPDGNLVHKAEPDESVVLAFTTKQKPKSLKNNPGNLYWDKDVDLEKASVIYKEEWDGKAWVPKVEEDETKPPEESNKLDKKDQHPHHRLKLPVGSIKDLKIKLRHMDGTTSWKKVPQGMVLNPLEAPEQDTGDVKKK